MRVVTDVESFKGKKQDLYSCPDYELILFDNEYSEIHLGLSEAVFQELKKWFNTLP